MSWEPSDSATHLSGGTGRLSGPTSSFTYCSSGYSHCCNLKETGHARCSLTIVAGFTAPGQSFAAASNFVRACYYSEFYSNCCTSIAAIGISSAAFDGGRGLSLLRYRSGLS